MEITYYASDIQAYWNWLEQTFGVRQTLSHPDLVQGYLGVVRITVHPADTKGPVGPGGQVAYWRVPDLTVALARLEARGARRFRGPVVGVDGRSVAQVQDPVGNIWGLVAEGRSADRPQEHQENG